MQERTEFVPDAGSTVSLREYGDILRRRRVIILQTFLVVMVAGIVITLFQTPVYRATSRLLVEPPSYIFNTPGSDPLASIFLLKNSYTPQTQVELLQSSKVRGEVAKGLGVPSVPEANVSVIEGTSIIQVDVEGDNKNMVQRTANKLLEIYVEQVEKGDNKALESAAKLAEREATKAHDDVEKTLKQLENFKTSKRIPDLINNREATQKIVSDLLTSYNQARAHADELQQRIQATQDKLRAIPETRSDIVSWEADPAVNNFQAKIDELDTELKALGQDLGPENIQVVLKTRQIAEYRKKILEYRRTFLARNQRLNPVSQELKDRLLGYDIDLVAASGLAASIAPQLQEATTRLNEFPRWENTYQGLEVRAKNSQDRLKYWEDHLRDIRLRNEAGRSPRLSVIEQAPLPGDPVRPKKGQQILLSVVIGLVLGLGIALLQELLDDRVNSAEEAERVLRLPNLGQVALIEEEGLRLIRDISTFSPLMESYRSLRTNINFAAVGSEMKSLLITSSMPAEGKSTTAANLAMAMALDGRRVIIVDADLRRPSQHKLFRIDVSPGLTDVLVGTHSLDEALQSSGVEGVRVLPAGSPPPNPAELLGSNAMMKVIADLEGLADVILFDSPPTLVVADSVVLSALVDGVLMVISFGDTKKASTRKAIDMLNRANAHVLGTVLNRIEGPSAGYYGYGRYYVSATLESPSPTRVPPSVTEPRAVASSEPTDETITSRRGE